MSNSFEQYEAIRQESELEDEVDLTASGDATAALEELSLLPTQSKRSDGPQHPDDPDRNPPDTRITYFSAYALLVSTVIGAGIFASPSQIDRNVPSPGVAILIWMVGGTIAWTGAASFAELGAAIPQNGGIQEYLAYVYGDHVGAVMSLSWIFASKPSSMAIVTLTFAEYWTSIIFSLESDNLWLNKLLAIFAITCVWLVNSSGATASTRLTNVLVFFKLFTVTLVLVIALLVATIGLNGDRKGPSQDWKMMSWFSRREKGVGGSSIDWTSLSNWELLGHVSAAIYAGLWAYDGWDAVNMVAGEMANTGRDLPRAIHSATPTVMICYVLASVAYYIILPWNTFQGSNAVAVASGQKAFGPVGGIVLAVLVSISCLGSVNSNIFTGGRLTIAAVHHGYLPRFLADPKQKDSHSFEEHLYHQGTDTQRISVRELHSVDGEGLLHGHIDPPIKAMAFNCLISYVYIVVGNFGALITFLGLAQYTFFFLAVLGGLILRAREPQLTRPYQPAIWVPIVFCTICFLLSLRGLIFAPFQGAFLGALVFLASLLNQYKSRGQERWQWFKFMKRDEDVVARSSSEP